MTKATSVPAGVDANDKGNVNTNYGSVIALTVSNFM